jgi:hypothetical protein
MDLITFITKNSFLLAIITIIVFLVFQFYIRPKYFNKPSSPNNSSSAADQKKGCAASQEVRSQSLTSEVIPPSIKDDKKRKFLDKLKENIEKIQNSDFVQDIRQEQESAKWDDMLPAEFKEDDSNDDNPFATKL